MHRFYLSPAFWDPDAPALEAEEAHHCLDVLRLGPGKRVTLFDGQGREMTAEIAAVERGRVTLRKLAEQRTPPPPCRITLGQAVPKGRNMEFILQKATELGVSAVAPLLSERVVRQIDPEEAGPRAERWGSIVIEAAKQCGQNWVPAVGTPKPMRAFLEQSTASDLCLIASLQPDARPLRDVLADAKTRAPRSATILIGPEGDFTPAETHLAKAHGYLPVTLGPIVLRTETAAIYTLSVLGYELF